MSRKTWLVISFLVGFIVLTGGLIGLIAYYERLPETLSQHETLVLGQNTLVPGSTAAMRVVVRDSRDASPLPNAQVEVRMRPADGGRAKALFSGTTNAAGNVDVAFVVPEDVEPRQMLIVETKSRLGSDTLEQAVTIERDYRILLTTDKPLYQPGQIIHIRALALGAFDMRPAAGQTIEVTVADGKGNTVFRRQLTASDYGVASVDFQLADEVNTGPYKLTATASPPLGGTGGGESAEKTVTVEHYVLPKFDVKMTTDRTYYRPGDRVEGSLTARYFFGKDVAGGVVKLEGYTFDFQRVVAVTLEGTTDDAGAFTFSFDLPDYIAGSELERGGARFYIEAAVTDLAEHTEVGRRSLPVAQGALIVNAVLEGGQPRVGVENILYVMTSYPDGSPAQADVTAFIRDTGESVTAQTGKYGLAEVHFTPANPYLSLYVEARDATGASTGQEFFYEGQWAEESVLLRPDAPVYRVGDTMWLTLLTSAQRGTVYVDIIREGQTVSTRAVDVTGGKAEVAVDLTPDLYGTLELHAYKILRTGAITRDTRLVVVDEANDLAVTLTPGADTYRPGEDATLDVLVRGADGAGVPSALGLAVVDESVFALAEQDPGFAKLYFMLEAELLQPKYELHGFGIPELIAYPYPVDDPVLREAQQGAGKAALASAIQQASPFSLNANSHEQSMRRAYEKQTTFYTGMANGLYGVALLIPLLVVASSAVAVWRGAEQRRWLRLLGSAGLSFGALIALALMLAGVVWAVNEIFWRSADEILLLLAGALGLLGLFGVIGLIVVAIRRKDGLLGLMLGLLPVFLVIALALGFSVSRGNVYPGDAVTMVGLLALVLLPLAFLLRGAGFAFERRALACVAALGMALLLSGAVVPLAFVMGGETGMRMAAMQPQEMLGDAIMLEAMPAPGERWVVKEVEVERVVEMEVAVEGQTAGEPPRLRQYFPETMLWLPDEVTDANGALRLEFPVADSITTWRVTALASSQDGRLGSATGGLRVFQDFFIDLDLPGSLTVGDEIAVPVGVFNYLPEAQSVRLEVQQERWFMLLDEPVKTLDIASNDITVVYFRIKALDFGRQPFQVTAYGSRMSDAIRKDVRVFPDGKELRFTVSDKLDPTLPVQETVQIPADAIPGTQKLIVKIYPGIVSQVVEGLDALLRMPFGCFEQTSSVTYPNILVLDYLKTTGQASPEVQMQAEQYINLGYQRLTTFEVPGAPGGFSLFGNPPADLMLTAYGLQQFGDMSRVYDIDPRLIERIAGWLLAQQTNDGSWQTVEGFRETTLTQMTDAMQVTAFVVWSLADAGYANDGRTAQGASFLRERASQVETAYDLGLVANALVSYDLALEGKTTGATDAVLDRLAGMAKDDGGAVYWDAGRHTYMGGSGNSAQLEATALAALAFIRADKHGDLANDALTYLVRNKDSFGTWDTTSATVLTLKALIASVKSGAEDADATVTVTLNGGQAKTVTVKPENFDVVQMLVFDDVPPGRESVIDIALSGKGNLMYQVAGSYYLPWDKLPFYPELLSAEELVTIDVTYDRAELAVNDTVGVDVVVTLNEGVAQSAIVDLGLPPGFSVETEDLARLVARYQDMPKDYGYAIIERYELTGRQIILYVSDLTAGQPLEFSYRLRAKFPLKAQTPASTAYDYYNPGIVGENAPQVLTVAGGE